MSCSAHCKMKYGSFGEDIAILRTLGMTPREVVGVFMTQGALIGWIGTIIGVIG